MAKKMTIKAYAQREATQKLQGQSPLREDGHFPPKKGKQRIMYMECKGGDLSGEARIGLATFSKTGKTLYYKGLKFQSLRGAGFKSNFFEAGSGSYYWISGPKKDGSDRLYGERVPIAIDPDIREEYWTSIRGLPERKGCKDFF